MSVRLQLSEAIYPRKCLDQAIAAYSGICSVQISEMNLKGCVIEIKPCVEIEADKDKAVHEFLNYLLDLSLESHLSLTRGIHT